MSPHPFPGREPAGEEPEGSARRPAGNGPGGPPGDAGRDEEQVPPGEGLPEGAEQGLFVTLPAEELSLAGFAEDGRADTWRPARCWPRSCPLSPDKRGRVCPGCPMTS